LIGQKGYNNTTLKDIAKEAGAGHTCQGGSGVQVVHWTPKQWGYN